MRVFALGHALIAPVGGELVERGLLDAPDDAFFLTLPELRRAIAGEDLRGTVVDRRGVCRRGQGRRHVPRVLLSDGTDAETEIAAPTDGAIRGTPASPGIARGTAHVIRSPVGARLEPGEVLVAPSTDPGWTPLFLTAGALVMEMGGVLSALVLSQFSPRWWFPRSWWIRPANGTGSQSQLPHPPLLIETISPIKGRPATPKLTRTRKPTSGSEE